MKLYREADELPLCFQPEGCEVEALASDEDLDEKVRRFLTVKALYRQTEDPKVQEETFRDLGLYEDPVNHLKIEGIYAKWIQRIQESSLKKRQR